MNHILPAEMLVEPARGTTMRRLYEQIDLCVCGNIQPCSSAADLDTINEIFFCVSKQIHGHLAGDELDAAFPGKVEQRSDRGNTVLDELGLHYGRCHGLHSRE